MADLFTTGKSKRTGGSFTVATSGGAELVKRLRKLENGGQVAIQRTVADFTTRAPAWVSKGIREHYGVDTAAIKEAAGKPRRGKTTIKVAGVTVDGATLEYKGRLLTPVHFKMSPKKAPDDQQQRQVRIPGQAIGDGSPVAMMRPPKKYKVKATIIKGKRVTVTSTGFLASSSKTKEGATIIPWQRVGDSRLPIHVIKTISVPQMIEGRARETIEQYISEGLTKRFEHHINQAMK